MPVTAMAVGAVAAPVVGGILGNMSASKARKEQKKAIKRALAELERLGVPPDLSKEIVVEELQRQGIYDPKMEETVEVAESEYKQIKEDPELQKAQLQALSGLQERAQVGLGAEDRAALNQVRREVQRDAEAKRQQVLQQMAARGMGGGGAELMAQLQAGQAGAEMASQQADTLMAQAQQRALQALGQSGEMAGQMQQAQFGRQSEIARALDERNRFMAENTISRQQRNVASLNQAQLANLAEQQRLHEANIAARRGEKERQAAETGAFWDRKKELAQAKSAAHLGQAAAAGQRAAATAQGWQQMGSAVGTGLGALAQGMNKPAAPTTNLPMDRAGGTTQFSRDYLAGNTGGYAQGGIVGNDRGATRGPDNTEASLREGEMVLNADQQKGLFEFINRIAKKYSED